MAIETIPVIDLGPFLAGEEGALDRTAKELRFALTEIGFYFIVNHGVPREKIRGVFDQVKRFHEQPVDRKLELKIDVNSTGYLPLRGNTLRTSTIPTNSAKCVDEPATADPFGVNGGQMPQPWTNAVFLATRPRATTRSGGERYARPFFCDSKIAWPIAAVPTTVGPDKPPKYPTTC